MPSIKKAVFPAAGLGTRLLPATKVIPKEMLTIVDRPLIQYVVEEAKAAGIEEFIFVTGRGKSAIEDHFDSAYELERTLAERGKHEALAELKAWLPDAGTVVYTRQQKPLGLGHAVWCARKLVGKDPFAVILPDEIVRHHTPCLKQMVDAHAQHGGNILGVFDVAPSETARYGILDIDGDSRGQLVKVKHLVEKPAPADAPSTLSINGRYILSPEIFAFLEQGKRGAGGEIQLTDAIASLIGKQPVFGFRFSGERHDCGSALGFLRANIAYAMERPEIRSQLTEIMKNSLEME